MHVWQSRSCRSTQPTMCVACRSTLFSRVQSPPEPIVACEAMILFGHSLSLACQLFDVPTWQRCGRFFASLQDCCFLYMKVSLNVQLLADNLQRRWSWVHVAVSRCFSKSGSWFCFQHSVVNNPHKTPIIPISSLPNPYRTRI